MSESFQIRILSFLLIISFFSCQSSQNTDPGSESAENGKKDSIPVQAEIKLKNSSKTEAYVYAISGLNLRESSDIKSKVLKVVPYGAKIEILEPPAGESMMVDGLKGGMSKAEYGQEGYLFDGYLGRFPAPGQKPEIKAYLTELEKAGFKADYYEHRLDEGGYIQESEGLVIPTKNWQEAFLLAKALFNIPAQVHLPKLTGKENRMENPKKTEYLWSDEVVVNCNAQEEIEDIYYYLRGEGGGRTVTIEPVAEGLRISQTFIVD